MKAFRDLTNEFKLMLNGFSEQQNTLECASYTLDLCGKV